MKIQELQEMIEKHTTDDKINFEDLNKDINTNFDALIEKKVSKAKESGKSEIIESFIKEQGYENIDQFTASVKNTKATSTELSEKVTRYESELEALRGENATLKSQNDDYAYMGKLSNVDPKYQKFVMSEIKGLINDDTDFDTAKETYLADNAHYLRDNEEKIVTKLPKGQTKTEHSDGVLGILSQKHGGIKLE